MQELKNSAKSLFDKGFLTVEMAGKDGKPMKYEDGKPKLQVVSKKGEIVVGMKDGVEYVLRFGEAYRGPEEDENATGDSRYIYAYARVNPNLLDQPELEPVPAPFVAPKKKSDDSSKTSKEKKGVKGPKVKKGNNPLPPLNPAGPPQILLRQALLPENLRFPYRKKSKALLLHQKRIQILPQLIKN